MESVLFSTPDNELPDNFKAGFFDGHDGRKLRYAIFRTTGQNAKGTIVLLHGRNECIEKYYETIRFFTEAGFWVATFDWRGQGGSERLLEGKQVGYVAKFSDYQQDVKIFLEKIVLPDARMPFFAMGHSMGGLVLLTIAPTISNRIDRIILAAPFLDIKVRGIKRKVANFILKFASLIGLGKMSLPSRKYDDNNLHIENLTSSLERFERNRQIFETYPEFETGSPTVRWLLQMFKAQKVVDSQRFLEQITVPTIILGATHDGIVPYDKLEDISTKFRAGQLIPFDGARHEILHELDIYREPALAAAEAFFSSPDEIYAPQSAKAE